ncbi:phospholipid/cholesterol/gamma-HCH transport system ATP-binding protein [Arboricoccus pini]|uniref:Phospholipid/cholesterol/gamma-HCH transport system ATP-binding protein n=1 Tax=Arboricoccus pini TaxID=1963835 RepID=A0A212QX45_9PROT|nr:ATP-binding cassette domain-containing protein [Arboricoccus pini]SNB64279.1 phospholipid/cholesterol/gamma-HCH transport system ATP-binding protein [Arboricoccus pini]
MAARETKISVKGLAKAFGRNHVLRGLDIEVEAGTSVVVIGGSGTGKSVLIKSILGIVEPDAGQILIDGQDVLAASRRQAQALRGQIGMLFQGAALFDSLPVWENVAFGLMAKAKIPRDQARVRAVETLEAVGLGEPVADLFPAELSGGMQKRVGLARAIATRPAILFFDEPTTGLDPIMADVINDLIRSVVSDLGATALSITHDMASVRKIADRVAMLYEGRIIWEGPAKDIDASGNPFVDQFVHGRADGPIATIQAPQRRAG